MSTHRTAICLGCRTSLAEGESCDLGCRAGTLSLANPQERELLIRGAWNNGMVRFSESRDPVNYQPLKLPGFLSASAVVLATTGVVGGTLGGLIVIAPWLLVPVLTSPSTRKLFSGVRFGKAKDHSMNRGVVSGTHSIAAPASGRECVAFSIRLTHTQSKSDTLIDAFSCGFDVKLAGGRLAHIPPGRIRLQGTGVTQSLSPRTDMPGWWAQVDPFHFHGERESPYPHTEIREEVLLPGQSLVLQNELIMTTRQHRDADYRDASANILEPRGVPHIKVVPDQLAG